MRLHVRRGQGSRATLLVLAWVVHSSAASALHAQGPSIDVDTPPGVPEGRGKLGPALGAAGTSETDSSPGQEQRPLSGRVGPSGPRAPASAVNPPTRPARGPAPRFRPQVLEPANVPHYGDLEIPSRTDAGAPEGGLTLDDAIETLLQENLNLIALRFEVQMAEADVLTASLRANPIFYADTQLQPYGHYGRANPGGPPQYDVNITYPLDVSHKRQARTLVSDTAKRVTEAQLQDAVRLQIDNLYTAYVDVVAADETLKYSRKYLDGITRLLDLNRELLKRGQVVEATIDAIHSQVEQAQLQVREATHALEKTKRTLALLLNVPRSGAALIGVHDPLRDARELPQQAENLLQMAMTNRPDLNALRLGVARAASDVRLAKANRFSDVYLLAQPYTLQDNRPFGLKSPYSWALGVTVPLPVYNRNQGNIERAKINVTQTQVELAALERQIENEVDEAVLEFRLSREAMLELEREVLPAAQRVRDSAYRRFLAGQTSAIEYLDAQKDYNEVVRQYRDALVRHRRSMLDLNTAVGVRILG
jgi:outer membrane protein, heavy metal efflux system